MSAKTTKTNYTAVTVLINRADNNINQNVDLINLVSLEFNTKKELMDKIEMINADVAIYKIVSSINIKEAMYTANIRINELTKNSEDISKLNATNIGELVLGDKQYWSILRGVTTRNFNHPSKSVSTSVIVSFDGMHVCSVIINKENIEEFVEQHEDCEIAKYEFKNNAEMNKFYTKLSNVLRRNKYNTFDEIIKLITSRTKIKGNVMTRTNDSELVTVYVCLPQDKSVAQVGVSVETEEEMKERMLRNNAKAYATYTVHEDKADKFVDVLSKAIVDADEQLQDTTFTEFMQFVTDEVCNDVTLYILEEDEDSVEENVEPKGKHLSIDEAIANLLEHMQVNKDEVECTGTSCVETHDNEIVYPANIYSAKFLESLNKFVFDSNTMTAADSNMVATWIEGVRGKPTLFVSTIIDDMKAAETKDYEQYLALKAKFENK